MHTHILFSVYYRDGRFFFGMSKTKQKKHICIDGIFVMCHIKNTYFRFNNTLIHFTNIHIKANDRRVL